MTSAKGASAQPGSATGASTPFATVNVSPFLWCVPLRDGAAAFPATVPRDLRDVIAGLVHPNPAWRPTAAAALQHPELQSEVQRMALQLAAEKQHVQQYREDVARLSKHRLARSNTWA